MDQSSNLWIETRIRAQASERRIKFTLHAHQEMLEEDISSAELVSSLRNCTLVENYPDHKRGACCLVCGPGNARMLHVVCTFEHPDLIIVTVDEPKRPKWQTAFKRGMRL